MPKADDACKTGVTDLAKLELVSVSKRFGRVTAVAGMRQIDDLTVIGGA